MGTMLMATSPDAVFPSELLNPISEEQGNRDYSGIVIGDYDVNARLDRVLSSGTFGQVYLGTLLSDPEEAPPLAASSPQPDSAPFTGDSSPTAAVNQPRRVAVKLEPKFGPNQLLNEGSVYRKLEGGPGIAHLFWFGINPRYNLNAMVCTLLGDSLYDKYTVCGNSLSLHTGLQLLDQMLTTLHYIHDRGIIHRDISPNNWLMGAESNQSKLYLVDFGLSKRFDNGPRFMPGSHRGRDFKVTRPVVGTMRFASVPSHRGETAARRDDMEAVGYLMVYLLKGRLPWQGLRACTAIEKFSMIAERKCSTSPVDLCSGLPNEFASYVDYTRSLKQYDIPDYASIKEIFRNLAESKGLCYNGKYDWSDKQAEELKVCSNIRNTSGDSGIADMFNLASI